MKKILILVAFSFLLSSSFVAYYSQKHWCAKIDVQKIMLGEENLSESSMYQCSDKNLVIWLQRDGTVVDVFAINSEVNKVGDVNSTDFIKFKSGVFSWEMPLNSVILGEIQAKNDDINPRLLSQPNSIEFFPYNNDKKVMITK